LLLERVDVFVAPGFKGEECGADGAVFVVEDVEGVYGVGGGHLFYGDALFAEGEVDVLELPGIFFLAEAEDDDLCKKGLDVKTSPTWSRVHDGEDAEGLDGDFGARLRPPEVRAALQNLQRPTDKKGRAYHLRRCHEEARRNYDGARNVDVAAELEAPGIHLRYLHAATSRPDRRRFHESHRTRQPSAQHALLLVARHQRPPHGKRRCKHRA